MYVIFLCYCFLYYFSLIEIHDIAIFLRGSVIATVNLVVEQSFLWKLILLKGGQLCPTYVRGMKFARTFTAGVFSNYLDFSLEVLRVGEAVRWPLTARFYNYLSYLLKKTKNGRKGNCVERDIFFIFRHPIYFRGLFVDSACNYIVRHAFFRWSWSTDESHLHGTTR